MNSFSKQRLRIKKKYASYGLAKEKSDEFNEEKQDNVIKDVE